ncbi:MAG: 50S ribosomal protein L18e [Candidatus Bathyarchaeota archaeon]|nr:MAG: 50S ribosomal protein L18e [Candidatus Bathyarchaeota archaeon]
MRQVKTTNPELISLVRLLRKKSRENEARIWRDLARHLSSSRRRRTTVNVSRLNRYTQQRETVVVPGKVLGAGKIDHAVSVAAFAFSDQAKLKILKAKGKCLFISDLVKKNPKGTSVKIIG